MTLKQRALLDVVKMLVIGMGTGVVISLSAIYIGAAITYGVVALVVLGYLVKTAYSMRVSQLELEQSRIERALREGK